MKFSEMFKVSRGHHDDWFDPILSIDTRLFLDPFLLYASEQGGFIGSHSDIISFFNSVFKLIARSNSKPHSLLWKKAVASLALPEVQELCLGYTGGGTGGSGSGPKIARLIAEAMSEAIQAGLIELTHFEEVAIIRQHIGADRISDLTAAIIRKRLTAYTEEICHRHQVPTQQFQFGRGYYNPETELWLPLQAHLPFNPYNKKSILLAPRHYLRDLPTINTDDFWDYSWSNENQVIRTEFSHDITKNVAKKEIVDFARRHPEIRYRYIMFREEYPPDPYNFQRDPKGLVNWYEATRQFCADNPLRLLIQSESDFYGAVDNMVDAFRHYVEDNRGWNLLWNENNTPRREEAAQDLFLGIIKQHCMANNIDVSREPDIGRGPVDFKVAQGYSTRALLEVKLAKNTKFWNGLEKQLPTYQRAEEVKIGYFVIIIYFDKDFKRLTSIQSRISQVQQRTGYSITPVVVDARRRPPSASKL